MDIPQGELAEALRNNPTDIEELEKTFALASYFNKQNALALSRLPMTGTIGKIQNYIIKLVKKDNLVESAIQGLENTLTRIGLDILDPGQSAWGINLVKAFKTNPETRTRLHVEADLHASGGTFAISLQTPLEIQGRFEDIDQYVDIENMARKIGETNLTYLGRGRNRTNHGVGIRLESLAQEDLLKALHKLEDLFQDLVEKLRPVFER